MGFLGTGQGQSKSNLSMGPTQRGREHSRRMCVLRPKEVTGNTYLFKESVLPEPEHHHVRPIPGPE